LEGACLYKKGNAKEGFDLLQMGITRLHKIISELAKHQNPLREKYCTEKQAWGIFFDVLDKLENGLNEGDPFAVDLKEKAKRLIKGCEISLQARPDP
jgi:hypothetical protein